MGMEKSDFFVDTKGHCLLCLGEIAPSTTSFHSIQALSKYLKLDRRKVFSGRGPIPQHLLKKAERSELKVELCVGCAALTGKFSKLFVELERIRLEMMACLHSIHGRLTKAEVGKTELFRGLDWGGFMGKMEILEALRKETVQKCSLAIQPRVRLLRLPKSSYPIASEVKVEPPSPPPADLPDAFQEDDDDQCYRATSQVEVEPVCDVNSNSQGIPQAGSSKIKKLAKSYTRNLATGHFSCNLCSKKFTLKSNLLRHLKTRYRCKLCERQFHIHDEYRRHQKTVHGEQLKQKYEKVVGSKIRRLRASDRLGLRKTRTAPVEANLKYVCKLCGVKLSSWRIYWEHYKRKHKDTDAGKTMTYGKIAELIRAKVKATPPESNGAEVLGGTEDRESGASNDVEVKIENDS